MAIRQRQLVRVARIRRLAWFCRSAAGIGYAYVTSQMGTSLTGDPRDVALRDALYAALAALAPHREAERHAS